MAPICACRSQLKTVIVPIKAFNASWHSTSRLGELIPGLAPYAVHKTRQTQPNHVRRFVTACTNARQARIAQAPSSVSNNVSNQKLSKAGAVLLSDTVPSEQEILNALQICEGLAQNLAKTAEIPHESVDSSATTDLLTLEARTYRKTPPAQDGGNGARTEIAENISKTAYRIAQDPKVFLTPKLLATYVNTLTILERPHSFPHIFDLYRSKPIPRPDTSPIQFAEPNGKAPTAAVPLAMAQIALDAAIDIKDLSLCFDIIDTSVCSPAFRRSKFIRKALLPLTGLTLSPIAAYSVASSLSHLQDTVDPHIITNMATVGLLAYIGFTTTVGVVAITTANDQMERITWYQGTPLRERWIREEERAFVDRIAQAWGLQNPESRGDEDGEDWQDLRRWVMARGMILDKPELMEGME